MSHLEDLLDKLVHNKISYADVIQEAEKPSVFVIINKEGYVSFVENFETQHLEDELLNEITGVILNSKIMEDGSDNFIERARIRGYNIIFRDLEGIRLCYAFIGKSYSAINKFRVLIKEFHELSNIWFDLNEKISIQRKIELNDRIRLSKYLQTIFVE